MAVFNPPILQASITPIFLHPPPLNKRTLGEIMIIDSHAHLHDEKFKDDLAAVLSRAKDANISHMVTIGCDIATTTRAQEVAQQRDNVYFSAGFHPHEAKDLNAESLAALKLLAEDKKCVAIGECGLDYYYEHSSKAQQQHAFVAQIELAQTLRLPLIIHLRDAFSDCIDIFDTFDDLRNRVVIHCFSGTLDEAKAFIERGFYLSLSGIITFKKPGDLPDVARLALDRLLVETDCPYLAPHPYRGQRNEPAYVVHTLDAIAQARGEDRASVEAQIYQNTRTFFGI